MGKNFKEFWKRQIAKFLAVSMTLSTLCSAGIPTIHAAETPLLEVDGRIISETAMEMIEQGGTWGTSFEFTAAVLNQIFGTTVATLDNSDPGNPQTIDLAKDINSLTTAEEDVLAAFDDSIDTGTAVPVTISGNGKKLAMRIMLCSLPTQADNAINNYKPIIINGNQYSDLVALYLGIEGSLINRDGVMSIGLGKQASIDALNARFDTTLSGTYTEPPVTGNHLGQSFGLVARNNNYILSNLPHIETYQYESADSVPALMIVPRSPINVPKQAIVRDVTDTDNYVTVNATITYETESGASYTANTDTTEKIIATATLPYGYTWAPGEDGVAEMGYWDTSAYIDVVLVNHSANFTVVDKYDSDVNLPNALLALEQKIGSNWQFVGYLVNGQFTANQIHRIRQAANTANYQFHVINSAPQPGYEIDPSEVLLDARFGNNLTKQFQEVSKHIIYIENIANDGTPMAGAKYTLTYGDYSEELTLDANGKASSAIFTDSGAETLVLTRDTDVTGYIPQNDRQTRTLALDDMTYSGNSSAFAYQFIDSDTKADYNHYVNIHLKDETNTAVSGVKLGIYTDDTCQTPALTELGTAITDAELTTNSLGDINLPEIPAGTYYVKLIRSTAGYTDVLFNPTTNNNVEIFTIIVLDDDNTTELNIGIKRQVGDIVLTVVDQDGSPVAGVEYELKVTSFTPSAYGGEELPTNVVVGTYTTDANGVIHITEMNEGAMNGYNLLNGNYSLNFVSSPDGYKTSKRAPFEIDLNWVEGEDVVSVTLRDAVEHVMQSSNFTVVNKNDSSAYLYDAILTLEQNINGSWQTVGDLDEWLLTTEQLNVIKTAATSPNYQFRIVNSVAQAGYVVDPAEVIFDARQDNNLTKQFQEVSKHIIHIENIANDGTPMAGAKYTLTYGDYSEELTLDANGQASSSIILASDEKTLTLVRNTSVEGYAPQASNQTRTISLSDMAYNNAEDAFAYSFSDEDTYIPPDYNHHIQIHLQDEAGIDVSSVQFGIYTDANCQTPAVPEDGVALTLNELTTTEQGLLSLREFPAGTYYIKLTSSTAGYSDILFDPATNEVKDIFAVTVVDDFNRTELNIGIKRQVGDITLTVLDTNGNPVVGAIYELKTVNIAPQEYAGITLPNDIIVGRYTTDNSGIIHITTMNRGPLDSHKIINGSYSLEFVSSPYGYKDSENMSLLFDINWTEHEDIVYDSARDVVKNVEYQTNLTVVDKYDDSISLNEAVLTLQQKVGDEWQDVGNLPAWELTPALISTIRAAANTENYEFRIINSAAHPGYETDKEAIALDARYDNNLTKEFKEPARFIVRINTVAEDTTPMTGAQYTLKYGAFSEVLTIDTNGNTESSLFLASGIDSLTLTRDTVVGDYVPQPENQSRTLNLSAMTFSANDNAFVYTFRDVDANPDYNHHINIQVVDEAHVGVENIRMGVFTDAECTIPAKTEENLDITEATLTTNNAGIIALPELPVGTYYIKLVRSTNGYSDTLFDPSTDVTQNVFVANVVDDFNVATITVGIKRQIGEITLTVVDETGAPVVGAVYELKTFNIVPSKYAGSVLDNNIVVGEYTTDSNGIIHITQMNRGPFNGHKLINGMYKLNFVSAPQGYKVSELGSFDINLGWQEHEELVSEIKEDFIERFVTYDLNITIIDDQVDTADLFSRYSTIDDVVFKDAYDNTLLPNVAYLTKGKDITLTVTNLNEIEVMINDELVIIPANTILLTHEVAGETFLHFDHFLYQPANAQSPIEIGIPAGSYRFDMDESGIGYEWLTEDFNTDVYDDVNRTIDITMRERITYTDLKFTKTDADYKTPIPGITFALLHVDVLRLHGLNMTDDNINNETITNFLLENNITPRYVATSDANGIVDFGKIPYGTYWLVEMHDNVSAHYAASQPIVINAIGGIINEEITNTNMSSFIRVKVLDAKTHEGVEGAEFTIQGESVVTTYTTDANGTFTTKDDYLTGEFVAENTKSALGYLITNNVQFSANNGVWSMETNNGPTTVNRKWDSTVNKWVVEIPIYVDQNNVTVTSVYNGAPLTNTTISICDENHNIVKTLINTTGNLTINGLPAGTYYITQNTVPGFVTLPEQQLVVDNTTPNYVVSFNNEKTLVTIKTLDAIGGWELDGVVVELYDDETLIATFDDDHKSHAGIPVGNYVLKTVTMPFGYQAPSADIAISVRDISDEQVFINNVMDTNDNPDETPDDKIIYEDNRTYGTISFQKKDAIDGHALVGVVFSFRYAQDVVIDGTTIYAGTEIATLITDKDGKAALSTPVPIAAYTQNGATPIMYSLVETTLPVGQYVVGEASIDLDNIQFNYVDAMTPLVELADIEIENNRPNIIVRAESDPETRLYDENGTVAGYADLTVLQNGQEVTYTIEVENNGNATGYDIDIRDILPPEFVVTNANTGTFSMENGVVYWHIPEIAAGETVKLVLKAKVDVDGAALLDNNISWTMPETPYAPGEQVDLEDESIVWNNLPTSQYQVIMFKSAASQDRIIMSAFDTLTLHYNFSAMDELTDFSFTDVIPEGLTYVEGSAKLNGEVYEDVVFDEETRTLTFLAPETWMNNMRFTFTLQVDYIQVGSEHEWETHANVTFLENAYTMKELTLYTDTITIIADALMDVEYYTDIETFIGDKANAEDVSVLKENDYVIYSAYIYNNGVSKLKNVMLKDILPEGMTFEPVEDDDKRTALYADDNEIVWFAAFINPGEAMEFSVKGTVKDQKAALIDNHVTYDVMKENVVNANGQMVKLLEFQNTARNTDSALFQVLEFHKAAEVVGKPNDNGKVAIGDTLVYTMSITAADIVNGIEITDKVPAGVTFVPGSAQIKLAGQNNWVNLKDAAVYDKTSKTVKFNVNPTNNEILTITEGVSYFRFSATVDRIGTNNANANNYNKATFTNAASLDYWALPFDEDSVETLESEAVTHMTEISVTGEKSGSIDTFEGEYADRKYVTVVAEGDELVFKISVKNSGANALTNVVVEDTVPANSTLVGKDGDTYTNKDGVLTWIIPEIKANETAEVSFTVKVTPPADKAVEIINQAKYAVPMDINNIKTSEWIQTNSVVYQAILIKMSSSVPGGVDATDAKTVEIGSTITYTITVENVDDIYGLNLSNKIPEGMEFVPDSAKVKIGDGTAEAAKFTLDGNTIKFNQFDEVKAGKMEVSFAVKVKDTTDYDKAVVFISQADVTLKPTKDAEKDLVMKTNPISHTTKKTNATDTPKLGLETTSASLVWGLITMVALAGIGVFGYFGFIEPKKRRK